MMPPGGKEEEEEEEEDSFLQLSRGRVDKAPRDSYFFPEGEEECVE